MSKRYMTVTYVQKVNGKWDELTDFKDNLKTRDLTSARVILDLHNKKIVKNTINREAGYDDMLEFYKRLLGEQILPHLPQESP